jgi:hypothetical protein
MRVVCLQGIAHNQWSPGGLTLIVLGEAGAEALPLVTLGPDLQMQQGWEQSVFAVYLKSIYTSICSVFAVYLQCILRVFAGYFKIICRGFAGNFKIICRVFAVYLQFICVNTWCYNHIRSPFPLQLSNVCICSAVQCSAVQCSAVQCSANQCVSCWVALHCLPTLPPFRSGLLQ